MNAPLKQVTATATATDPRHAFLCVAASHYKLADAGDEPLDIAFAATVRLLDHMFPPPDPCCPTCGLAPCGNPSFCAACRRIDQKGKRR